MLALDPDAKAGSYSGSSQDLSVHQAEAYGDLKPIKPKHSSLPIGSYPSCLFGHRI